MLQEIRGSLHETLGRLGRDRVDLFFLHCHVRPTEIGPTPVTIGIDVVRDVVRPEFERLREEGLIGGWGLTGTAHPDAICDLLEDDSKPSAIQCVANVLDAVGGLWPFGANGRPDNRRIRATAVTQGVAVMGIRPLAAGALADSFDRAPAADAPETADFQNAAGFRAFARTEGVSAAYLAYRYALSLPALATVIIGAKNRLELAECLAAEAAGPLSEDEMDAIRSSCAVEQGARA
jgi:aryl-alcohol dehydrogenase-like predicted oxidoreductase